VTAGGGCAAAIPALLVGQWGLLGATTQLEIREDGSGSISGSVWGSEAVTWLARGNRLSVTFERGSGSADYAISADNELVLSDAQGFVLVAGTYKCIPDDGFAASAEARSF